MLQWGVSDDNKKSQRRGQRPGSWQRPTRGRYADNHIRNTRTVKATLYVCKVEDH